jgi:hypothetical protein
MTSNTIGRFYRMLGRFRFVIALFALLCCSAAQSYAAENLECPEIGPGRVPDLIGDAIGGGLFATENRIELANEINDSTGCKSAIPTSRGATCRTC